MKYDIDIITKVVDEFKITPNKKYLSRKYNIPRATLKYWIQKDIPNRNKELEESNKNVIFQKIVSRPEMYSYILGLYLGDGYISLNGRNKISYKMRIAQDLKYPNLISKIEKNLELFFNSKSSIGKSKGCSQITIYNKYLPIYFPQHGDGKKHNRPIKLNTFQYSIVDLGELLKGLWESDGSFYIANVGQYKYERYNFTNKSLDIISLFEECLDKLKIGYKTRQKIDKIWIVEIQKKSEVIKMKKVVGIKN